MPWACMCSMKYKNQIYYTSLKYKNTNFAYQINQTLQITQYMKDFIKYKYDRK